MVRPEDGLVAFSTDQRQEEKNAKDQPYFKNGRTRSYVQNVYYSMALQQAAMTVATPVKNRRGELVAILAGHLNLAELSHIMQAGRQFSSTRDAYLVNRFNFFVTEPRFGKSYALKKSIHTHGVDAALSGETGIARYGDYRGEPVIGAYRWLPKRELALLVEIDQAEAFEPIKALKSTVVTVCVVVTGIAALIGWLLASTVSRPLKRLAEDTVRVGKGDLTFKADATGNDEVADLSRAFARMTSELNESLVSREALVAEMAERVHAERTIQKERDFSGTLINGLPGVFYLFDKETLQFNRWNRNFETVTGYSAAEISGMTPLEFFDEVDGPRVAERIGEVFERGQSSVTANFLTKDGERIPHFLTGVALTIDGKDYLLGAGIDITQQIRAQEALEESEDRFRRLAENAKDMIYRMSLPDGAYEYVSPAAKDIFGHSPQVFYQSPQLIRATIHPDWIEYFQKQWENLLSGDMPPTYEYQIIDAAGNVKWLNQRNVLIRDDAGRPAAIEGIVTDVTDIRRITHEQIRLEKFAVLGQVAAGIAHELNNPLMGVLNYAQYCKEHTADDDRRYGILSDIEMETKRCIDIVKNFMGASRLEGDTIGMLEDIAPGPILERVVHLMEYRTSKENVMVTLDIGEDLPSVRMNGESFQQLCINLFTNAVDALDGVATKTVSLELRGDHDSLQLTVADTGCGIPGDLQDKVFDAFFTTKPPGKGTGLGLATCYKIVHQMGGVIDFHSTAGSGTIMTIRLPTRQKASTMTMRRKRHEHAHIGDR